MVSIPAKKVSFSISFLNSTPCRDTQVVRRDSENPIVALTDAKLLRLKNI